MKRTIDEVFSFIVFSQDHGVEKPDPRIFRIAMDQAGCTRDELLHVGDSRDTDVQGARNAGVMYVWLNRHHVSPPLIETNDHVIATLTELLDLLEW